MAVSEELVKKSKKPVKKLSEIIRPYILTPDKEITGSVNGVSFFFPRGEPSELTLEQYEVLVNSSYAEELRG